MKKTIVILVVLVFLMGILISCNQESNTVEPLATEAPVDTGTTEPVNPDDSGTAEPVDPDGVDPDEPVQPDDVDVDTPVSPDDTGSNDIEVSSDDTAGLAEEFVDLLVTGKFKAAEGKFDSTMTESLPEGGLEATWGDLIAKTGPFKEQISTRTEIIEGYDVVFVTCSFGEAFVDVQVTFNNKQEVAGLFFRPAIDPEVSDELIGVAEEYVYLLCDGDFDTAVSKCDLKMKEVLTAESLQEAWDGQLEKVGFFVEQTGSRAQEIDGYDVVFVRCKFEKKDLDIQITFNSEKEVAGLFFLDVQP